MKILVLGDIHGRPIWREIIEKETPDQVIFLGDFITSHDGYTDEQQIEELRAALEYKSKHPNTIILRGNHDMDGLGYYWAQCFPSVSKYIRERMDKSKSLGKQFLEASQWIHIAQVGDRKVIFAHAGVTSDWMEQILKVDISTPEKLHEALVGINDLEPSEKFAFTGGFWDSRGTDPQQSCTWIRPATLCEHNVPGYDQVVGHTPFMIPIKARHAVRAHRTKDDMGATVWNTARTGELIWCCDELRIGSYLIIEDDKFIPKQL